MKAIFSHKKEAPQPELKSVQRGYVGMDGVMVPTTEGYKEMKVVATYDTSKAKGAVADNLYYKALLANRRSLGSMYG